MDAIENLLNTRLSELTPTEREVFASRWNYRQSLRRGELLSDDHLFFIEKGALRVVAESGDKEVTVALGYTGNCVFNMPSFLTGMPSEFYIQTIRQTELIGIHRTALVELIGMYAPVAAFWQQIIRQLLLSFADREIDLLTSSPADRVKRMRDRSPELFREVPLRYIAAYLRMSPETLSRLSKS